MSVTRKGLPVVESFVSVIGFAFEGNCLCLVQLIRM